MKGSDIHALALSHLTRRSIIDRENWNYITWFPFGFNSLTLASSARLPFLNYDLPFFLYIYFASSLLVPHSGMFMLDMIFF